VDDRQRLLGDKKQVALRRAELFKPHIKSLTAFVQRLRKRGHGKVPYFDPWDGGISAKALFLFEKPGPKAFASGFVSRNNNDRTAENTFNFMKAACIPRKQTCLWNVVPGWNGTIRLTSAELRKGADALLELLDLLRDLRVVVLVGRRAACAWSQFDDPPRLPTICSAHPSPINYACAPEAWEAIPAQWAKVRRFLR